MDTLKPGAHSVAAQPQVVPPQAASPQVATRPFFFSIRYKITIAFIIIIAVTTFCFGYPIYRADRDWIEQSLGLRLQSMAATAALSIDGDAHENIMPSPEGEAIGSYQDREIRIFGVDEFRSIRNFLRRTVEANELKTDIYTLRPGAQEGMMEFVVMTNENPYTGNLYPMSMQLARVFATGAPAHSDLYSDAHGAWLSAYAPIRNGSGNVVGVLEIDYDVTQFIHKLDERIRALVFIGLMSLAAGLAISILISRRITSPILHLSEKMERIKAGDLDVKAEIRTSDEIEHAGEVFNSMVEGLRAKQKLLSYVSKAAWESAHRRAESDSGVLEGVTKKATLLFSDIKGFTPMSSSRTAHEVVAILNQYFSGMTAAVFRHDGSIDKFIGDAIMAVFEGGDDFGASAAVRAAIDMQNVRLGPELDAILKTRIGINTGEIVMGDIGSIEWRRDYTCIGDNVNRTQRFEATCTPGKVHISEATYELVKHLFKVTPRGPTQLKGVEHPVQTYEVDPADPYPDPTKATADA